MPKKIFLHQPDDNACTIYRCTLPFLHCYHELAENDIHITASLKTLKHEEFDVYIFNRLIRDEFYTQMVIPLIEMDKKLVWQCDDNLWCIPNWNPSLKQLGKNDLISTRAYINDCHRLFVSTQPLADYIGYPDKTEIVPNLVDLCQFEKEIEREPGPIKILWGGGSSHEKDLDVIVESVAHISEKFKNEVVIIFWGYFPTQLSNFDRIAGAPYAQLVPKYENMYFGEWFSNREYFHKLRQLKPDIALMPLDNCEFNLSKSNLKFLEMSMAGAACIATNLPPYNCIRNDTGILINPENNNEWEERIEELILNKELRLKINQAAREQIKQEFSWQCPKKDIWLKAFLNL